MATQKSAEFIVELRGEPSPVPTIVRLRRGLKLLLRTCQLRCTACRQVDGQDIALDAPDASTGQPNAFQAIPDGTPQAGASEPLDPGGSDAQTNV